MILIIGGAGFIGSHTVKLLNSKGYETLVLDNFSTGHRSLLKWGPYIEGDFGDNELVKSILKNHPIDGVMHFAANAYVAESVSNPLKYYSNNVLNTINLLNAIVETNQKKDFFFIFSSTCATYGIPEKFPIEETQHQIPVNPYGRTKLAVEHMIRDYSKAYGLKYSILRYFNAAGADPELETGEWHDPESHLIPLILEAAYNKSSINIYGDDYPTADGTCIRDYIHVNDLAAAHIMAMEDLIKNYKSTIFNLGNGKGYSILDVINSAKRITGYDIDTVFADRRPGDPPTLIGSSDRIQKQLGWVPQISTLDDIIETAWNWYKKMEMSRAGGT